MDYLREIRRIAEHDWLAAANEIVFLLMRDPDGFTREDFYNICCQFAGKTSQGFAGQNRPLLR